jgi:hypothetical protein
MTGKDAIRESVEALRLRVEQHRRLLFEMEADGAAAHELTACSHVDCPHERRLKQTLVEVIEVLESSRRAFKSKQLEGLRRRLVRMLAG